MLIDTGTWQVVYGLLFIGLFVVNVCRFFVLLVVYGKSTCILCIVVVGGVLFCLACIIVLLYGAILG